MSDGNQSIIREKRTGLSRYFYFIERLTSDVRTGLLRFIQFLNDVYTMVHEITGQFLGRLVIGFAAAYGFVISTDYQKPRLLRFFLNSVKLVLGLPLIAISFIVLSLVGFIGGTLAGALGLRNLGEYSRVEQVAAWLMLLAGALLLPKYAGSYLLYKASLCCVFATILLGLNFLYGQCGITSLGQAAFVLIGGFLTTLLYNGTLGFSLPFIVSLLISSVFAGGLGYILGAPSLRIKDYYLTVITLAFTIAIPQILRSHYFSGLVGSQEGLQINKLPPPHVLSQMTNPVWAYYFIFSSFFVLLIFAYNIQVNSQIGRAFRVIKCDDVIARAQGVNVPRYKLMAFVFSAFYGAYAGGMMMMISDYVSSETYTINDSIDYFIGLAIGGPGSILGSVIGSAFLSFEPDLTKVVSNAVVGGQSLARVVYGVLLIVMICFFPQGLAGMIRNFARLKFVRRIRRGAYYMVPPPDYDIVAAKDYRDIKEQKAHEH